MEPGARQVYRLHVYRPVRHAHRAEEERHHDLQQQGQRCPAAGPLPGQFGGQRPHTGLLRQTGDARLMDGGRVRHQRRRGVPCNRRGTVAPGFAQRGHSPGRAARGRLRHGRGHQEPGHDTEAVGLVGKRPVSDAIYLGTDARHLLRKHHRQRLLRGTGRGHGRPLGHREHSRQERPLHLAGEEHGRVYRPHAVQNIHQSGAGRILQ